MKKEASKSLENTLLPSNGKYSHILLKADSHKAGSRVRVYEIIVCHGALLCRLTYQACVLASACQDEELFIEPCLVLYPNPTCIKQSSGQPAPAPAAAPAAARAACCGLIFFPSLLYRTRGGGALFLRPSRDRTLESGQPHKFSRQERVYSKIGAFSNTVETG